MFGFGKKKKKEEHRKIERVRASKKLVHAAKKALICENEEGNVVGYADVRGLLEGVKYDATYDLETIQRELDSLPVTVPTRPLTEEQVIALIADLIK